MKKPTIGIIGGNGKMGQWFKRFFEKSKFRVIISDLDTKLTNKGLVERSDAVLFSVPISKTVEVIESVLPFTRKEQTLMDLTSIKTPAVDTMLKSDCEVLGMHPMFGPMTCSIKGQTLILCKARERNRTGVIETLFKTAGAKIKVSTPEKHDKMMSIIQGLNHFTSIVLGHSIMKLGLDIDESLEYTSPIYKLRMDMVGRILEQDPKMYAEIEMENPHTTGTLKVLSESSEELRKLIEKKDCAGFVKYFESSAEHLGDFKSRAMKESNYLIEKMVKKNEE